MSVKSQLQSCMNTVILISFNKCANGKSTNNNL